MAYMNDSEQDLRRRRDLYRLIIARDCMNSVAETIQLAIKYKVNANHELFNIMHDSIVTNYGRAFVKMNPFGQISSKYEKLEDREMADTHKMLMYSRHKHVAHTEYFPNRVVLYPSGTERFDDSIASVPQFEIKKTYFSHHAYQSILKLAGWQTGMLLFDIENRIRELYGKNGEKIVDVTELITPDDVNLLKKQTKLK